jgi:hypothetical protein
MRYNNFLNEDVVSSALGLGEPEVGKSYPSEKVKRYLEMINKALSAMTKKEENDANDSIVQDLRDKKSKWSNVDKETKPKKTITEPPPEQQQEEPPPEEEQPPPPPKKKKKEEEEQQESKIKQFIGGTLDEMAYRKGGKADKIVNKIVYDWPDWYYHDVSIKELAKDLSKQYRITTKQAKFIIDVWGDFNDNRLNLGEFQEFVHGILQGDKYYGP